MLITHSQRRAASLLALLSAFAVPAGAGDGIELRRTGDDIVHVRAADWRGLGTGIGYAQAQDAPCTLAEAFVTFRGERSRHFGAEARPARDSTFGRPTNLELDVFFKVFADDELVARYRAAQPVELRELIDGYARGYNRRIAELRQHRDAAGAPACAHAPWLSAIAPADIYRRLYAANLAAGYAHFIPEIVNAAPATQPAPAADLGARLAHRIGDRDGIGSNVLAFGGAATQGEGGVLFGNPHWYWGGPDRFWQMHLSLPGAIDVAGVAFLGVPVVMIGFNRDVAWSHTVSAARRFGLFDLTLDPADPTRYLVDGVSEPMRERVVTIELRGPGGAPRRIERRVYLTRHGPVVDLGARHPALGWGRDHALALRDVNADNFGVFANFLDWGRARSLDEFAAIQRRNLAVPWVTTAAIGRGDARAWFADIGAVPDVPDELRAACVTERARGFAAIDPLTPVLDGSRSACDWRTSANAPRPGSLPASAQPGLWRADYVANMNDSYWLANPSQPLEGYASVLGGERQALSWRGRAGHALAQTLLASPLPARDFAARLRSAVLAGRPHTAELFRDALVAGACAPSAAGRAAGPAATVTPSLDEACAVLRRWSLGADAGDRGALLWESFWTGLDGPDGETLFATPFSAAAPLATPAAPRATDPRVAQALGAAVLDFRRKGWRLDRPLGRELRVDLAGTPLPLYGGCPALGHFTVNCSADDSHVLDANAIANSYLQVVSFGADGVAAHTLLAHGQRETALAGGAGAAPVRRYARRDWLRFPFTDAQIAADPALRVRQLAP
ncbi:penicillin acylase family protein [Derxia lacustris]|uniref:penicillin acylase family protein n=1 Tax=Derxia lacustris TaxID=764842 RepID=UPI000A16D48D|nr:penicillin acylase family protein [Derxia lacustris]